jgi:Flp pilus assembly protein TadG
MLLKIQETIQKARDDERGDIITALFMVPFVLFMLFAFVNMAVYFQARSTVGNIARDGARQVALYGGNSKSIPLNKTGKDVSQVVFDTLYSGGKCSLSNCSQAPSVTCTPGTATTPGQQVSCSVTYYYTPVSTDIFGFSKITSQPFTLKETFISETGY